MIIPKISSEKELDSGNICPMNIEQDSKEEEIETDMNDAKEEEENIGEEEDEVKEEQEEDVTEDEIEEEEEEEEDEEETEGLAEDHEEETCVSKLFFQLKTLVKMLQKSMTLSPEEQSVY